MADCVLNSSKITDYYLNLKNLECAPLTTGTLPSVSDGDWIFRSDLHI